MRRRNEPARPRDTLTSRTRLLPGSPYWNYLRHHNDVSKFRWKINAAPRRGAASPRDANGCFRCRFDSYELNLRIKSFGFGKKSARVGGNAVFGWAIADF
jgi:hypothetical protein